MVKQINCSHIFLNYTILGDQSPQSLSRLMDLDSFKESFTSFQQCPLCQAESMSWNCQLRDSGEIQWAGDHQAHFSWIEAVSESEKEAVALLRGLLCGWQSPRVWRTTSCVSRLSKRSKHPRHRSQISIPLEGRSFPDQLAVIIKIMIIIVAIISNNIIIIITTAIIIYIIPNVLLAIYSMEAMLAL